MSFGSRNSYSVHKTPSIERTVFNTQNFTTEHETRCDILREMKYVNGIFLFFYLL